MALVLWGLRLIAVTDTGIDQILVAIVGVFGLMIATTIPLLWSARARGKRTETSVDTMLEHFPGNGRLLSDRIEDIHKSVQSQQVLLNHLVQSVDSHHNDLTIHRKEE